MVLVVAALAATGLSVGWVWTKAEAVSPVPLPTVGKPMETVNPSAKPTKTPTPFGKVLGTEMVAANNDTMPIMSSAWGNNYERAGLWGGAAIWLTVHSNYDKGKSWGNYVAFGQLPPDITYTNTAAGLKQASIQVGGRALYNLYDKDAQVIKGSATHKAISVNGHPGHELVAKVAVKVPKLPETFSTIMIAVVDRGDGTAAVSIADIAGSTPAWQNVWRYKVSQIKLSK
ncbi:hypothetical protein EV137_1454 [Kribbella pratensis]|uniref:Glycosyl hydrolase family 98 putative carbohydrate-binding module domain-containing protein n=1 Tax=Kribbella pratensis TaxID=2512112 RepID=A0ABY2FN11_9ACTN|nr:hypothetical protein EV137_1454 [Kribbella pratensis]TDX02760.1 hypothetical protein EV647_0978 [Kribbella sp. VKM Ac-2566]